ncbi:MAG: hypothetical protein HYS07_08060 [Chlamydiae bacterium]|nr:hypothetical protein [Chlamydiota bacterium]MBI3277683.1 hypothetical protein [Chlamydiota bacterium]
MMSSSLPQFLVKLFWDVDFDRLCLTEHRHFILKRVLDHGDQEAILWMRHTFRDEEIKSSLKKYRSFSRKSANFWALIYDIQKDSVPCLKRHLLKDPGIVWPY